MLAAMSESHRNEYLSRIHRAQDFIEKNLGHKLTLEDIAHSASFSPYHFHRIFSATTGETLYQFISRLRLEKAAGLLGQTPERSITEIALDVGFGSSATFARAFQVAFGMSASDFRKNCKTDRKNSKAVLEADAYLDGQAISPPARSAIMNRIQPKEPQSIDVRAMPAKILAYLRHVGPYASDPTLFERLWGEFFQWAGPRGLAGRPESEMLCIFHDNPDITEQDKLRISLGITVPAGTPTSPPIGLLDLPAGQYVSAHYEIDPRDYGGTWAYVMGVWMPQSGYQPSDGPCYECYLNDPKTHPQGKHIVDIRVPVQPL
jgi:AraC family transcriptional regulator